eukprot:844474-Rhodomonas_salina.1
MPTAAGVGSGWCCLVSPSIPASPGIHMQARHEVVVNVSRHDDLVLVRRVSGPDPDGLFESSRAESLALHPR